MIAQLRESINDDVTYYTQQVSTRQTPAIVAAGGQLTIHAAALSNTAAQLLAGGDVSVTTGGDVHNAAGTIESRSGDVKLDAAALNNSRGAGTWLSAWQFNFQGVDAHNNEEDFYEVIKQADTAPAGVISAARDVRAYHRGRAGE